MYTWNNHVGIRQQQGCGVLAPEARDSDGSLCRTEKNKKTKLSNAAMCMRLLECNLITTMSCASLAVSAVSVGGKIELIDFVCHAHVVVEGSLKGECVSGRIAAMLFLWSWKLNLSRSILKMTGMFARFLPNFVVDSYNQRIQTVHHLFSLLIT